MPIDFYCLPASPPCRAVQLVAAVVGVELNQKIVNLMKKEQYTPQFLKINPQHTVPAIDDNGFYLAESRAILSYLVDKYAKNDSLYPKDINKRAIVNQRLYFDIITLYESFRIAYLVPLFFGTPKDAALIKKFDDALELLEQFLEKDYYVAGSNLTIADLSIFITISDLEVVAHDFGKYKSIKRWLARVKDETAKFEEASEEGNRAFKEFVQLREK